MSNNFLVELEVQEGKIELKWISADFEMNDKSITLKDKIALTNSLISIASDNAEGDLDKLSVLRTLSTPFCMNIDDTKK